MPKAPNKFTSQTIQTILPRLHATYPMTLNGQEYLKRLLERFHLVSMPVELLE